MPNRAPVRCLWVAAMLALLATTTTDAAPPPDRLPSISERTRSMQHLPGFLTLHSDAVSGKLYLEIRRLGEDLLYVDSLPYGSGSNDLGLDRGELSDSRIVRFERFGTKILLVQPNGRFRSSSASPAEQLTVRQSFAESVLAGFSIEAQDPGEAGAGGAVLVDATEFFERDAHDVAEALARNQKEGYKLDPARCAIALDATKSFPKNTEVETLLTFVAPHLEPGGYVRDVAPDPHALTIRQRQSFVELPGPGYEPRRFDPRAGYFGISYRDYSAPLGAPLEQAFISRHRLLKRDPACTSACVAVQPIQYYVDRGAPEPIRTALLEGARWWDEAFQAAGWAPGTFRVDLLPDDADPMDLRYNIIQWVHRYTRGWSMGTVVTDPRTGEILKGNVTLGSLRGRQDYLIAESLLAPYSAQGDVAAQDRPLVQFVLARLRQLAAHETGHTLGLMHNFGASAYGHAPEQTVSVMEYPFPWITLTPAGIPDLSRAYGVGIGAWDRTTIDFGYRQFAAGTDEAQALGAILATSQRSGLLYITDDDARPAGGAHPHAHLWDNGADPVAELDRIMAIRAVALTRFGENAIRPGVPMAALADTLVPLYLLHRYQTEAAIKMIGGLDYRYQLRGDGQPDARIVPAQEQQRALAAVLRTLSPAFLTLPESLLAKMPPRPAGLERTRESFPAHTGLTFDPVASAESAADLTLRLLFNRERAARLIEYGARDSGTLSLSTTIDKTLAATLPARTQPAGASSLSGVVQQAVYLRTIEALLALAADPEAAPGVRATLQAKLPTLRRPTGVASVDAYVAARVALFERAPEKFVAAMPVTTPPGMPIGDDGN